MLNERKVRLMTRMAMYESKDGVEDLKITAYHRKDYTSFQTVITIIWITIGYAIAVGVGMVTFMDMIMNNLDDMAFLIFLGVIIVVAYLIIVIGYGITASRFYGRKHDEAKHRVKIFNHDLTRLNKIYERER